MSHSTEFFGYDDTATWPLKKDYSKWKLTFFKPWWNSENELKGVDGMFKSALEDYMWNVDEFPWMIRQEILRSLRNEVSVDFSAARALGGDNDNTPTEVRTMLDTRMQLRQQTVPQNYMNWDRISVRTLMILTPAGHLYPQKKMAGSVSLE